MCFRFESVTGVLGSHTGSDICGFLSCPGCWGGGGTRMHTHTCRGRERRTDRKACTYVFPHRGMGKAGKGEIYTHTFISQSQNGSYQHRVIYWGINNIIHTGIGSQDKASHFQEYYDFELGKWAFLITSCDLQMRPQAAWVPTQQPLHCAFTQTGLKSSYWVKGNPFQALYAGVDWLARSSGTFSMGQPCEGWFFFSNSGIISFICKGCRSQQSLLACLQVNLSRWLMHNAL